MHLTHGEAAHGAGVGDDERGQRAEGEGTLAGGRDFPAGLASRSFFPPSLSSLLLHMFVQFYCSLYNQLQNMKCFLVLVCAAEA